MNTLSCNVKARLTVTNVHDSSRRETKMALHT